MAKTNITKLLFILYLIILFAPAVLSNHSLLTRPSYIVIYIISILFYFRLKKGNELDGIMKILFVFVLIHLFYYIFGEKVAYSFDRYGNVTPTPLYSNVVKIFSAFSSLTITYYLRLENKINNKDIVVLFYVFFLYSIVAYLGNIDAVASNSLSDVGVGEMTNNIGYLFACLLPYIFFINNRNRQFIFLSICTIFIIISAKRGAILIWACFIIHYWCVNFFGGKKQLSFIILTVIGVLVVALPLIHFVESSSYMMERVSQTMEGNSSYRDEMYSMMFNYIIENRDIKNMIFGFGIGTVINRMGLGAHNDWLEILTSYGLMGGVLYFGLICLLFRKSVSRGTVEYKQPLIALTYTWIIKSLVSDVFYAGGETPMMFILIGYILACNRENIQSIKFKSKECGLCK